MGLGLALADFTWSTLMAPLLYTQKRTAVKAITQALPDLPVQIGGGIRDCNTIESYLNAGVRSLLPAVKNPPSRPANASPATSLLVSMRKPVCRHGRLG